jgi:hypothetical protein
MAPVFVGQTPVLPDCSFPGCEKWGIYDHHVTYEPPVIKPLCREHHEDITIINRAKAGRQKSPLSNRQRWWIWYQWREGKLKPRRTRGALEYVSEWDR